MANSLTKIVTLSPNYFAFLSGIAISIATKLVTGLAIEKYGEKFGWLILVPTILFTIAGITFISISWALAEPHQKWRTINRELGWSENEIRKISIGDKTLLLWALLCIGFLSFLIGFVILFASGAN